MATVQQDPQVQAPSDSTMSPSELFKFSAWVHVGLSAAGCEDAETGACANPLHFHAWVRLPNQFQHQDIRERALAAKARRIRQLRDPETDAYTILEGDIADLRRGDETKPLIDELMSIDWWKRQLDAMRDVEAREEFKTLEKDRERMAELRAMAEDQRPADEFGELERHLTAYAETVEAERAQTERPLRESLEGMALDELLEQIREQRISAEGSTVFMETYSKWEWFAGSYASADMVDRRRRFQSIDQLEQSAPEVIEALRVAFSEMETSLQRGPQGN